MKAGMTLETSLILPIFLFSILGLISIMDIMKIKACVDLAVVEVGNEIAIERYSKDMATPLFSYSLEKKINSFLEKNLPKDDFKRVEKTLSIKKISGIDEENIVSFELNYRIIPKFRILDFITIGLTATYYGHDWCGWRTTDQAETMVFLSDYASVYHMDKNCKYLNVTIISVGYKSLEKYRNNDGDKYRKCNFCITGKIGDKVYITPEGNSFHTSDNCIGLTRSLHTVPISAVKGKRVCLGCGE